MRRSLQALRELLEVSRKHRAERIIAIGTEVLRKASNAEEFLKECQRLGIAVEVTSSEREAYLSYLSVAEDPTLANLAVALAVLDVGGGSVELSRGSGTELHRTDSYALGAVLLSEQFLHNDPPTRSQVEALVSHVHSTLREVPPLMEQELLVGVGGTFVNLASLQQEFAVFEPERAHGVHLSVQQVQELARTLCQLPLAERRKLPGIEPERAPVLHAGALITLATMQLLQAKHLQVSMKGLRWGVLYEYANAHRD